MGPAQDRPDIARARPQEPADFAVVIAVVVAEDEGGSGVRLEVLERAGDQLPFGEVGRGIVAISVAHMGTLEDVSHDWHRQGPNSPPTDLVEGSMTDDSVKPGTQRPIRVVLLPAFKCPCERVVGRVDGRFWITQDGEGDPIDVVGMVSVGLLNGLPACFEVAHGSCTRGAGDSLRGAAAHANRRF